jgi:DNA primase
MMNYEGLEFVDAVEELARHAGMTVPRDTVSRPKPEVSLYETLESTNQFFQRQLQNSPQAKQYLEKRGLSEKVVKNYEVGYAPAGWNGLMDHFDRRSDAMTLLQKTGMLSQGKKGNYDKFRDRIMFPIHDRRGRVIAFGGRALSDDGPKYLNSPETELFHKGRELYGLYLARKSQAKLDRIIVVEGYMDVVALAQFGFTQCVATLGTATSSEHAELGFRAADEIVYCFDGDKAGRKAAWRALESTLPRLREGRQARFLFLPDGEDPDSMVRSQGAAVFEELLNSSQPLSAFFFDHFTAMVDMGSIDGRAKLVDLARPLLQRIPEGVFRSMMQSQLETLARHKLEIEVQTKEDRRSQSRKTNTDLTTQRTPMRLALAHLVQNPALVAEVSEEQQFRACDLPGMDIYRELIDFCAKHPNMTTAQLMEIWRDHPAQPHLLTLATWSLEGEAETQVREFRDALTGLELVWTEKQIERIPPRIVDQTEEERKLVRDLQQQKQLLKHTLAN